jgi:hypothetical protein
MWDRSVDSAVAGYLVHVGTESGNYSQTFDVGDVTSFAFTGAAAGQRYFFAVASYFHGPIVGPRSQEVSGSSNAAPTLINPGTRTGVVGAPVVLELSGSDPQGQPVSYGASSLPPGLSISSATGYISGTPSVAGTYLVIATVTDGVLSDAETFSWTIAQAGSPSSPGGSTAPVGTTPGGTPPGGNAPDGDAPGGTPPAADTSFDGGSGPAADPIAPTVRITMPTTSPSHRANRALVTIGGTASDNAGVVAVEWSSSTGGSGVATGTDGWIAGVPIGPGSTTITVRARDAAGNVAGDSIVVTAGWGAIGRRETGTGRRAVSRGDQRPFARRSQR